MVLDPRPSVRALAQQRLPLSSSLLLLKRLFLLSQLDQPQFAILKQCVQFLKLFLHIFAFLNTPVILPFSEVTAHLPSIKSLLHLVSVLSDLLQVVCVLLHVLVDVAVVLKLLLIFIFKPL